MTPYLPLPQPAKTTSKIDLVRQNLRVVKQLHPTLSKIELMSLSDLTRALHLSVRQGEISYINGKWYVTHAGLLRVALRHRCCGIRTVLQEPQSDPIAGRWVFKATVYKSPGSKGFVGYGDADPSNVSSMVGGAELRIAETRAVNRALRKAYGIGLCSVEELGAFSSQPSPSATPPPSNGHSSSNVNSNGQPRLRDQLCLLIRQYNLDANLVKAYAADFCGTQALSEASRELVESFISHLSSAAKENRDALICKLNSYSQPVEATL
ncbi:MAG: hypothetical protein WBR26_01540 [Candidatus Acidiferrum sp.]